MIGITGLAHASGTTHFAILTANYLCGVGRQKNAVLEWNKSHCFENIRQACNAGMRGDFFTVMENDYFPEAGEDQLLFCVGGKYHYIIIDFGDNYEKVRTEFLRCDYKFVVVSLSEWQIGAFLDFIRDRNSREKKELEYFVSFGSEETRTEAEQALHISLKRIPISVDAFTVTKEVLAFFEVIL